MFFLVFSAYLCSRYKPSSLFLIIHYCTKSSAKGKFCSFDLTDSYS
ncbi:hypothetical protein HMPREF0352_1564, partial [Enterococcus faecium TX1330]